MMMHIDLYLAVLLLAPVVAIFWALLVRRGSAWVNLLAAAAVTIAALLLLPQSGTPRVAADGLLYVDRLGAWVVLCIALVYLLASLHAVDYMRHDPEQKRKPMFYALFAGFALAMLAASLANDLGVYWIGIEMTTLVSTFLVGYERQVESLEAAWKYIIIVSAGLSLALLGTVILYWGGSFVLGPTYTLNWLTLQAIAAKMPASLLRLGFFLALIGYGVKAGLAPMHTWLPDAHSEGPAPVSAMLSGALLNTAMLGIVRILGATDIAGQGAWPHRVLIGLGLLSVFVGAMFIVRQRGIKRLMAYSSVEHMGVIALGFGFGGPLGIAGALYHMLNHSLNKSLMFFGAGNAIHRFRTHQMSSMRNMVRALPRSAWIWLAGAIAITGAPPFGLFRSELAILRAGWHKDTLVVAVLLLLLLIVIFVGFLNHFRAMYAGSPEEPLPDGPTPGWLGVLPMVLALLGLLVLGLWWPPVLQTWFAGIAHSLGTAP